MKNYFAQWNVMRIIRFALAIWIISEGLYRQEWLLAFAGVLFSLMPLFNVGCCSVSACDISQSKTHVEQHEISGYEEIQ